ncbi:bifunctional 4-hydroxy-2-oxoglutarate aldolase/2-dehydro-3-deoxy-phosphogluconate aldolase [Pseudoalteromonas sp. NZS127_1]|uniref:bifunctional 4-hydroxy-2-oxoglutarate aldolase/2-dehydro-3-deoxy-phosphogluconate aldolase n=1 Tax=unclassified Pseudoalteromonas TaxID=194690 RepID=UPI0013FE2931|nr:MULTISPECIES: bifunctional 4-hydroxy-2-oxoglutarate aldolase/2-dehydro-3-deoxy-phosphogluconate aldolase [unclassified Pseudoalteromonas]MBG9994030.1 bifunctional 4-hydroxy-2-oxoglutarate aldolase/2-dehydro-3-deoxy-phosphogluconate aldolase [Pseudoalteromonas sp. NZS127_1]MBH0017404.1 bifunctional 4-hydroxy-2-oxoglutarate aldolase/2-dehydro-3-deoxy-phosphogluconate aldolase [Pseudoalteromonas sp. NGC95]MBH0027020.1 bifunctional 4-hydroxy-2-oxoglutarate aldolase/2-dehydro-3-deoxy-phosphoglucon
MTSNLDTQRLNTSALIKQYKLLAILRLKQQSDVAPLIDCLVNAGINALEITSNTPGFEQEITKARAAHKNALIGAGTIINTTLAQQAIDAGAQFIVTPNTNKSVVELAHQHGLPVLMGALTPTDVANAIEYKADIIKVFPAGSMGVGYFKALTGPFSEAQLIPVGGVNLDNLSQWFEAGACGAAVSGDFCKVLNTEQERSHLTKLVKNYISKLPK